MDMTSNWICAKHKDKNGLYNVSACHRNRVGECSSVYMDMTEKELIKAIENLTKALENSKKIKL